MAWVGDTRSLMRENIDSALTLVYDSIDCGPSQIDTHWNSSIAMISLMITRRLGLCFCFTRWLRSREIKHPPWDEVPQCLDLVDVYNPDVIKPPLSGRVPGVWNMTTRTDQPMPGQDVILGSKPMDDSGRGLWIIQSWLSCHLGEDG